MTDYNEEFDGIRIAEQNQADNHWTFSFEIGNGESLIEYLVDVDRDHWARLTNRRIEPAELVRLTFQFLLERESKELILKKFNIADVSGHFPTYESEIKRFF